MRDTRISLQLEGVASGQVVDGSDEPVDGAEVRIGYERTLPGSGLFANFARGVTITESDGLFEIRRLVPDTPVALQTELDGRQSDPITISVGPRHGPARPRAAPAVVSRPGTRRCGSFVALFPRAFGSA